MVKDDRLLFVELKSATGRLTAEQTEWLQALGFVASVACWRPAHWLDGTVERMLRDVSVRTQPGNRSPEWLLFRCQVTIVKAGRKRMTARVIDAGAWKVKRRGARWSCSCPAARCPHVQAVARLADQPVSARKRAGRDGGD